MAGARARKLDVSAMLTGSTNIASILMRAGEAEARGAASILGGIGTGIAQAGQNVREDKRLKQAQAERAEERGYQRSRDQFRDSLALKAEARAERDQAIQEDDHKRKVASEAKAVEDTTMWLNRAKASMATGMPMDPKVIEEIQKRVTSIQAGGGPEAIMARAAGQIEADPEGLLSETARLESLSKILWTQMGREKNGQLHAALGDTIEQLASLTAVNRKRLEIHDANVKRHGEQEKAKQEATAKVMVERDLLARMADDPKEPMTAAQFAYADDLVNTGGMTAEQARSMALGQKSPEEQAALEAREKNELERLRPPKREPEPEEKGEAWRREQEARGEMLPEQKREQEAKEKEAKAAEKTESERREGESRARAEYEKWLREGGKDAADDVKREMARSFMRQYGVLR